MRNESKGATNWVLLPVDHETRGGDANQREILDAVETDDCDDGCNGKQNAQTALKMVGNAKLDAIDENGNDVMPESGDISPGMSFALFCTKCGTRFPDADDMFCGKCGTPRKSL